MEAAKEILIDVQNVSKKFCKSLKLNMLYGTLDILKLNKKKNLKTLRKKEFWALKDISFKLHRGDALGIVGLNGAGKTTLIRLLMGSFPVTSGNIYKKGLITTIFERSIAFQRYYSGIENIKVKCALFGMSRKETNSKLKEIIEFAELQEFADAPFGSYSAGMRSRSNFAVAIAANPDVLIIDEGLAVGDILFRQKCLNKAKEMSKDCGIILISHNMEQYRELVNRMIVMEHGRIIMDTNDVEKAITFIQTKKQE